MLAANSLTRSVPVTMRLCSRIAVIVATTVLLVSAATAQESADSAKSNTNGFMLAFFLNGTTINSDDFDDASSGGGFTAQFGYGFAPRFTLLLGLSGARLDDDPDEFLLAHIDAIARFSFRSPTHAFVPFIEGGFSILAAGQDDAVIDIGSGPETFDVEMAGVATTFGGGFNYFVSPTFALGANLQLSWGDFTTVKLDEVEIDDLEIEANAARLNFGLTWYPMRPR